jgi:putative transposase
MDHIWSYGFIEEKLQNKRKIRVLNIVDEFTHECLASEAERRFKGHAVAEVLRYLFWCAAARSISAAIMDRSFTVQQ